MPTKITRWCNKHPMLTGIYASCGLMTVVLFEIFYLPFLPILAYATFLAFLSFGLGIIIHDDIVTNTRTYISGVLTLTTLGAIATVIKVSFPFGYLLLALFTWMAFWLIMAVRFLRHNEAKPSTPNLHLIQNTDS